MFGRDLRKISICFGNWPIADFFHDQAIFLKDYELYIIGHSLLSLPSKGIFIQLSKCKNILPFQRQVETTVNVTNEKLLTSKQVKLATGKK